MPALLDSANCDSSRFRSFLNCTRKHESVERSSSITRTHTYSDCMHDTKQKILECVPLPNAMAAQPNTGGDLCESSVIPFLAPRRKAWLTPAGGVPCSNAANIGLGEGKTWTQGESCSWQNSVSGQEPAKMYA